MKCTYCPGPAELMVTLTLRSGRELKPYPVCASHVPVMLATGPMEGVLWGVRVLAKPLAVQEALPGTDPSKATDQEKRRALAIYRGLRERGQAPAAALRSAEGVIAQCCVDSLSPSAGDLRMALGFVRMSAYVRSELRPVVDRWVAREAEFDRLLRLRPPLPKEPSAMARLNATAARVSGRPLEVLGLCPECGGRELTVDAVGVYTCLAADCGSTFSSSAGRSLTVVGGGGGGSSYVLVEPRRVPGATYLAGAVADALASSAGEPAVPPGRVCGPMDGPGEGERSWHCWPPACTRTVECPLDTGR